MEITLETIEDVEVFLRKTPSLANLQHWSKLYSATPHLSGHLSHAESIRDLWISYGIPTELVRYDVLQNFPIRVALTLHSPDGGLEYEAKLTEPFIPEDANSSPNHGFPAFHGFSAHGIVESELVYANFATLGDFELLASNGIDVKGKIVICKYGKVFRGLKVRAAIRYGAVGVVMYNDPQEDGDFTVKKGHLAYPHGPARHPDSIQRGSVDYFSVAVGDPTTPGHPSLPGRDTERQDTKHAIPTIPSLPISYADAQPLLKALNGQGAALRESNDSPSDWRGELDGVDYFTGPNAAKVTLVNESTSYPIPSYNSHRRYRPSIVKYEIKPIYNVIGTIEGTSDDMIVLGNHHDSWSCSAIDLVSGSLVMNEVARVLGLLASRDWIHERTMYDGISTPAPRRVVIHEPLTQFLWKRDTL